MGRPSRCGPPLSTTSLGGPRRGGELCPLKAMLLGAGEPESWFMDCSPPAAAWELPPPQGEELGAELGSLEEMGAAFTEPSLAASSLGSWANECERADAALGAAEAQMGRGCPDESLGDDTATARDPLEEEDWEWLTALGAATVPPPPHPVGTVGWPLGQQEAPKSVQGPPPAKGAQRNPGLAPGKGGVAFKAGAELSLLGSSRRQRGINLQYNLTFRESSVWDSWVQYLVPGIIHS